MLSKQIESLVASTPYLISNLANVSAVIYDQMKDLNWAGFYLMKEGKLVLGPFQGKLACIEIPVGRGVCGTAVERDATMLVEDVHQFPGHIACDCASNSEIVIPLHLNGEIFGVLDIDSPLVGRFTKEDQEKLEAAVKAIEKYLPEMR